MVVEIQTLEAEKRVRGRLKDGGWISISNTGSGYEWVVPAQKSADEEELLKEKTKVIENANQMIKEPTAPIDSNMAKGKQLETDIKNLKAETAAKRWRRRPRSGRRSSRSSTRTRRTRYPPCTRRRSRRKPSRTRPSSR